MRWCLITGSSPPDVCGVGDYTEHLSTALQASGEQVVVFHRNNWSIGQLWRHLSDLRRLELDFYLLQYPTEGYGYSMLPQLLMLGLLGRRRAVTLHEYARKSTKGKMAIYAFFLTGCKFVFTNELDARFARQWAPWIGRPRIIAIGSNIPWNTKQVPEFDVSYFGLIRPHKGIEKFLIDACSLKAKMPDTRIALIGNVPRGYEGYAREVFDQSAKSGFVVLNGLDPGSVGTLLAKSKICFFPFEDGLSERRGSVLAAMGNGSLVVGTSFEQNVSLSFKGAVVVITKERNLREIFELNEKGLLDETKEYARGYCLSRSWDNIAAEHVRAFKGAVE
jgi:glycosyltransferase involved in cell wall biosynthesis